MSGLSENCRLSFEELAAVFSLAGKNTLVDFRSEGDRALTGQDLWNACCALVRDGLLLQSGDGFAISSELFSLLQPALEGKTAMIMTPGSEAYAQMIYYGEGRLTALERSSCGGYLLTVLDARELEQDLAQRLELVYPEETDPTQLLAEIPVAADADWGTLLKNATMVLEQLELSTGQRIGWLRIVEQGIFHWIQWSRGGKVYCEPLLRDRMIGLLEQFQEGAVRS